MVVSGLVFGLGFSAVVGASMVVFVVYVLPLMLSDEQRYGIDEHGIAQTPEYMAKKKQMEAWNYQVENFPPY